VLEKYGFAVSEIEAASEIITNSPTQDDCNRGNNRDAQENQT
jgi:hypothetical protein